MKGLDGRFFRRVRRGFTLVEMLVVIGIIGILIGVMLVSFGGATDSARAAQCLSNMRSLAMAVNARAMESSFYPIAGSSEMLDLGMRMSYAPLHGWIAWLDDNKYSGGTSPSHQKVEQFPFYGTDREEDAEWAFTNGAIWRAVGKSRSVYTCPVYNRFRQSRKQKPVYYSYVMNSLFGWDTSEGTKAVFPSDWPGVFKYNDNQDGVLKHPDKTLLFAELPTIDPESGEEAEEAPAGTAGDSVLQYQKISGYSSGYAAKGEAESIGFVHTTSRKERCAHVAFADGHTEKVVWHKGGVSPKELTAYLCLGLDVVEDGRSGWKLAPSIEDEK